MFSLNSLFIFVGIETTIRRGRKLCGDGDKKYNPVLRLEKNAPHSLLILCLNEKSPSSGAPTSLVRQTSLTMLLPPLELLLEYPPTSTNHLKTDYINYNYIFFSYYLLISHFLIIYLFEVLFIYNSFFLLKKTHFGHLNHSNNL